MTQDDDPTGVSRLLAGLRETGPMPEDLVQRIRTSLDEEQVAREDTADDDGFWEPGDESVPDEEEHPERRRHGRMVLAGAAGLVAVAALGSLLVGILGDDEGKKSAASSPQPSVTTTAESSSSKGEVPAFVITRSETDYSKGDFADQAAPLLKGPSGLSGEPDDELVGTMDTAAGARDCLTRLGHTELIPVAVDIATFDGEPGLAIVGELPPDGGAKAFAVTTGCEPIWPEPVEVSGG